MLEAFRHAAHAVLLMIRTRLFVSSVFIIVLGVGWWYFLGSEKSVPMQTLTVTKGDFVTQVTVSGKVKSASQVDLGFAQAGRVTGVYTSVGNSVSAGALLAQVENDDLRALVEQRQAVLANQRAKLRSLEAGTRPESIAVTQSQLESAKTAYAESTIALQNALADAYTTSDAAVHNVVDLFVSNPRSEFPQIVFQTSDLQMTSDFVAARVKAESMLSQWSNTVSTTPAAVTENINQIVRLLEMANAVLNRGISNQSTPQSSINALVTSVSAARTSVNGALSTLTAAMTAEKSAANAVVTAQNNLKLAQAGATQADLDAQRAQVQSAQADVDSARAQLARTLITAPFSGTVTKVDAKRGQIASTNVPLISMMSRGVFEIEVYVPELSIAKVKVGNTATVTLDALPDAQFEAKVISIDPAETVRDGVASYKVTLEFSENNARLKSGLTTDVTITTERRSDVLLIPEGAVTEKDGDMAVVISRPDATSEERKVVTGEVSSTGLIEIISGLSVGDLVLVPSQK
ncbi:efflux RND transporter periplasmic adaptor subunit [bacterium]|nr:efflux RND transporter periplasmic adaptor subunit [bacterium]